MQRGMNWRAGGFAGRRYKCFDVIDVTGRDKPARPPALQIRMSRGNPLLSNIQDLVVLHAQAPLVRILFDELHAPLKIGKGYRTVTLKPRRD